ncbi:MAG: hypothetical protein Q9M26_01935, partial [Mariprofundales bacterium]|nr:hypothetical protein [Mariprofundales bacterium]
SFYTPGTTTGKMSLVARDIFGSSVPQVHWGQVAVTAVDPYTGTATMGDMSLRGDIGSVAGASVGFTYLTGSYIKSSSGIPTNLLVFRYKNSGGGRLFISTSVGLRRGIYFTTDINNKMTSIGDVYMSKVDSVAPSGFTAGATHDVTTANINPGMPGMTRTAALGQGLTPSIAVPGGMSIPIGVNVKDGYIDSSVVTSFPELMVFEGSMFVMKKDANNDFANNQDHLRVVEFFESGAMQGEEIIGGTVPHTALKMRNFPGNFVGFVHKQGDPTPVFSGKLNFLARTMYASSYASFANAYTTGSLTITAPSTTTAGSATMVATPASTTAATSTLTVDVPASGAPGVYHIHGAITGGGYIDIVWPIGGTKALYAVSTNATGTIKEVGEAYLTE